MIVLLLSKPLNYIILEVEGQPQYFTDRKAGLIVFGRISTLQTSMALEPTKEETQVNEVGQYKM